MNCDNKNRSLETLIRSLRIQAGCARKRGSDHDKGFAVAAQWTADCLMEIMHPVKDHYLGLSFRAANCLRSAGLRTREDVIKAVKEGQLMPNTYYNYGKKTHAEVLEWLGD